MSNDSMKRIVSAILKKELPEGEPLTLDGAPVGLSIRELSHLQSIGLVDYRTGEQAFVRSFGPQELFEIFHLCGVLEAGAIRLGCNRMSRDRLHEVRGGMLALIESFNGHGGAEWSATALDYISHLHDLILGNCTAERLTWEIARYDQLMQAVRELIAGQQQELVDSLRQFVRVMDALLLRDAEHAATILSNHFHAAAFRRIDLIFGPEAREMIVDPTLVGGRSG